MSPCHLALPDKQTHPQLQSSSTESLMIFMSPWYLSQLSPNTQTPDRLLWAVFSDPPANYFYSCKQANHQAYQRSLAPTATVRSSKLLISKQMLSVTDDTRRCNNTLYVGQSIILLFFLSWGGRRTRSEGPPSAFPSPYYIAKKD